MGEGREERRSRRREVLLRRQDSRRSSGGVAPSEVDILEGLFWGEWWDGERVGGDGCVVVYDGFELVGSRRAVAVTASVL